VKESSGEGLATHTNPESSGATSEDGIDALTGALAGWVCQGQRPEPVPEARDLGCDVLYKGRTKYAGLKVSDVKKLRRLEEENRRLKQMVAEQALDIQKSGGTDSPIGDMTPMEVIHSHQNQGQRS